MRKPTPEEQALWPAPNYDSPDDLHAPVIGATATTFLLAVLCKSRLLCKAIAGRLTCVHAVLITRILSKRLLRQRLEEDDYLVLAAMVSRILGTD